MADSDLERTHPLTVATKSAALLMQMVWGFVAAAVFASSGQFAFAVVAFAAVGASIVISVSVAWMNWWFFRFGVAGDDLLIVQGVIVKKRRAIPLSRVQGVDIRADLLSRILGLADVVVQTAGGGDGEAEARIGSIPLSDAEGLRASLLHSKEAVSVSDTDVAVGSDPAGRMSDLRGVFGGREAGRVASSAEYRLPFGRLVLAGATSNAVFAVLAAGAVFVFEGADLLGADLFDRAPSSATDVTPLLALAGAATGALLFAVAVAVVVARDFGFVARRAGGRIETESGLLERRMTSMPVARIQAVRVEATPLRRALGFAAVHVDTAGFGATSEEQHTLAPSLLPLVRSAEVRPLLHALLPEAAAFPATRRVPRRALRFYVLVPALTTVAFVGAAGSGLLALGLTLAPDSRLTALGPLALAVSLVGATGWTAFHRYLRWRAAEYGADSRALAIQNGALGLTRARLPRTRIQSLTIRQNPFQRRAGLATLAATTVIGSSASVHRVRHLSSTDAERIAEWYSPSGVDGATLATNNRG